jgi:hypothetical protein
MINLNIENLKNTPTGPSQSEVDKRIGQMVRASNLRTQEPNPAAAIESAKYSASIPVLLNELSLRSEPEVEFMLASVSKVGIALAQAQVLEALPLEGIPATAEVLAELVKRSPASLDAPKFAQLKSFIQQELAEYINLKSADKDTDPILGLIADKISQFLQTNKILIDKQDLAYQILTLSSNSATRLLKNLTTQTGSQTVEQRLAELAPSYESTVTLENCAHWLQQRPNVGKMSDFSAMLDDLVHKVASGQASEGEILIAESLKNNSEDFEFDFTNSEFGKNLQPDWDIYEKTGYYPCVYWVKELTDAGWPIHMVMATVVTLRNKQTGQIVSFFHHKIIETTYAKANQTLATDQGQIQFPDEFDPFYKQGYTVPVKQKFANKFRSEMSDFVTQLGIQ